MADFPQIVPMLSYEDVGGAADWLGRAFGFEENDRIEHEGEVVHVELRLGRGVVMLGRPGESYVNPKRLREQCEAAAQMYSVPWVVDGVWVQVGDIDEHFEQAKAAGARLLSEIEDGPVGRLYRVEDHEGHRWMFAQEQ
jgi:PhnB protein